MDDGQQLSKNGAPTQPAPTTAAGSAERDRANETRVGPITLDWKVSVTTVVAALVSAYALFLQATGYWKGAAPTLQPADKVLVQAIDGVVHVGTRMVYTNDGSNGYNALILWESASFKLGEEEYRQFAENRGTYARDEATGQPTLDDASDAAPFIVPAMQLVTHESLFSARERTAASSPWKDRLRQADFVGMLERERRRGTIEFVFKAASRDISGFHAGRARLLEARCVVTLDDGFIRRMKNEGWTSRSCRRQDR